MRTQTNATRSMPKSAICSATANETYDPSRSLEPERLHKQKKFHTNHSTLRWIGFYARRPISPPPAQHFLPQYRAAGTSSGGTAVIRQPRRTLRKRNTTHAGFITLEAPDCTLASRKPCERQAPFLPACTTPQAPRSLLVTLTECAHSTSLRGLPRTTTCSHCASCRITFI